MAIEEIKSLLREFVERNSNVVGIQWDLRLLPRLLINPYSKDYGKRRKAAHYFLLVASVDESRVIGMAENARKLLVHLHKRFGDKLFEVCESKELEDGVKKCQFYDEFGPLRGTIPSVLASVNKFVRHVARGDLIEYAQRFSKPKDMVEQIARHVKRMGGSFKEKSWMYMRWMVRPKPDLRIFDHFSPCELFIPLTTDITNVAVSLGLMDKVGPSWWEEAERVTRARERVTQFAGTFFPEDPAKVDYPFFLLGRWLRGKDLGIQVLKESLQLFDNVPKETGRACVEYQIIGRYESGWEKKVAETLSKMKIPFHLKPIRFPLPNNMFYTPDFVLRELRIKKRKIVLEPHGIMREGDARKFSLFKQIYRNDYFLMLIVRNDDIPSIPREAYDDIWPIEYVPQFLYLSKNNRYRPLNGLFTP